MSSMREGGAPAETDGNGVAVTGQSPQDAIAQLITLAVDVLRALGGTGPTRLELPSGVVTEAELGLTQRAAPGLRALRSSLQDYVDRTEQVPATDGSTSRATDALRDLLEIVLDAPLRLPGEGKREKPADANGLDDAVKEAAAAAVALEQAAGSGGTQPDGSDQMWTVRNLTAHPLELRDREDAVWVIPAHGRRAVTRSPRIEFGLRHEEGRGEVEVIEEPTPTPVDYSPLALWFFIVPGAVVAASTRGTWGWLGGVIAVALPLVWVFAATAKRREGLRGFLAELPAWALQAVTFLIVLTFCLAVPAATLSGGHPLEQDEIQVTCSSVELLAGWNDERGPTS